MGGTLLDIGREEPWAGGTNWTEGSSGTFTLLPEAGGMMPVPAVSISFVLDAFNIHDMNSCDLRDGRDEGPPGSSPSSTISSKTNIKLACTWVLLKGSLIFITYQTG